MAEAEADATTLVQGIQADTATAPDLEQAAAVQIATDAAQQRGERLNNQLRSAPVPLDPALEPSVQLLESMGFSRQRAVKCLIEADGNLEAAITSMVTAPDSPAGDPMLIPGKQPGGWHQLSIKELYSRIQTIEYFSKMPRVNDSRHLAKLCKTEATMASHWGDEDFSWSLNLEPAFYNAMCSEGLLPICSRLGKEGPFVIMPKHHMERCVVCVQDGALTAFAATAGSRSRFRLTVDTCFEGVIAGCIKQHGESWLHPPIQHVMRTIISAAPANGAITTMELWDDNNQLVAGEVGYATGSIYTSFSGFYTVSGSGKAQMQQTAECLLAAGFTCWDLGQELPYKKSMLGAKLMPRAAFYELYRSCRSETRTSTRELPNVAIALGVKRDAAGSSGAPADEAAPNQKLAVVSAWQHAVAARAGARERLMAREQYVELEPLSKSASKKIAKLKRRHGKEDADE